MNVSLVASSFSRLIVTFTIMSRRYWLASVGPMFLSLMVASTRLSTLVITSVALHTACVLGGHSMMVLASRSEM